jgi:CBS domain-containing protein/ribosome-associated translation inhibitor RaiA
MRSVLMRLREIMSTDVVAVAPSEAATVAWAKMRRHRIRHLVVTERKQIVGVVSDRDLGGRNGAAVRKGHTVAELMTPRTVTAKPDTTIRQAANLMRGRQIGSLPVLDEDTLVGIVTATDVLDELGRGSTRPTIKAERPTLRLPAGHERIGGRKRQRARARRSVRGRVRKADSAERAPMPGQVARPVKRQSGRTPTTRVPAHVRATGGELDRDDRDYLQRRLGTRLGKFAEAIERISVRLADVNGPRGGIDQVCRIKVVLSGLPSVVVERRDAALHAAIDDALDAAERAVRRSVQRRRMKPLHGRSAAAS